MENSPVNEEEKPLDLNPEAKPPTETRVAKLDNIAMAGGQSPALVQPAEGKDSYVPEARFILGSDDNKIMLSSLKGDETPRGGNYFLTKAQLALKHSSIVQKNVKEMNARIKDEQASAVGYPGVLPYTAVKAAAGALTNIKVHPEADFLLKRGSTPEAIVTGILRDSARAQYYVGKYEFDNKLSKFLERYPALIDSPIAMFEALKQSNFFDSPEEEQFFKDNSSVSYGVRYGTDPYSIIKEKYEKKLKGQFHESNLVERLKQSGKKLDWNSPDDRAVFRRYLKWTDEHGTSVSETMTSMASMLTEAASKSLYGIVDSAGNPEIGWTDAWKDGTATPDKEIRKAKLKEKLIQLAKTSNGEGLGNFTGKGALALVDKELSASGDFDFGLLDDAKQKKLPTLIIELNEEIKELKKQGALTEDWGGGITSALTFLDSAVTGTMGLGLLLTPQNQNSWLASFEAFIGAGVTSISADVIRRADMLSNPHSAQMYTSKSKDATLADYYEMMKMEQFNNALLVHGKWEHIAEAGMLPDSVIDSRWHKNASMITDISAVLGPIKGVINAGMFFAEGTRIEQAAVRAKLAFERSLIMSKINAMADKAFSFDFSGHGAIQATINRVKEVAKAGGEIIDDYEALRRIQTNRLVEMPHPTEPGQWVPATPTFKQGVLKVLDEQVEASQRTRNAIEKELAAALNAPKYSQKSSYIMQKARKALAEADSSIDWELVSDAEVYQAIRNNKVPKLKIQVKQADGTFVQVEKEAFNANEWRYITTEVGRNWKPLTVNGKAGFAGRQTLPLQVSWSWTNNLVTRAPNRFFNWLNEISVAAQARQKLYTPDGSVINASMTTVAHNTTAMQAGSMPAQGYKYWLVANGLPYIGRALGYVGGIGTFINDYGRIAVREATYLGGPKHGSVFLGMAADYQAQMRQLIKERISLGVADLPENMRAAQVKEWMQKLTDLGETSVKEVPQSAVQGVNRDIRIAQIDDALKTLNKNFDWSKKMHFLEKDMALGMGIREFTNGVKSGVVNEAIIGIAEGWNNLGTGTVISAFGGTQHLVTRSFARNMTTMKTLSERVNYDFSDLFGYMAGMSDVDRANTLEIIQQLRENADAFAKKTGSTQLGEREFAKSLSILSMLHRTRVKLRFHEEGVVDGMSILFQNEGLMQDASLTELRAEYEKLASKQGFKGEEAKAVAQEMIDARARQNAASIRITSIAKDIEFLTVEKRKLLEGTGEAASIYKQTIRNMLDAAGFNPDTFLASKDTTINGQELPADLDPKVRQKIMGLLTEYERIQQMDKENVLKVKDIDARITELNDERVQLAVNAKGFVFETGRIYQNSNDGSTLMSFKKGVTVYEKNGEVSVYLDKKMYNNADALEEIIHALWFANNMQSVRPMVMNGLLGTWKVNEAGVSVMVKPPLIAETPEAAFELMDLFVNAYAKERLSPDEAASFVAGWETGKKRFVKNPDDVSYLMPAIMELVARGYVERMMLSKPHTGIGPADPSTASGAANLSGSVTGSGPLSFIARFLVGDLTLEDALNNGQPFNVGASGYRENPNFENDMGKRIKGMAKTLQFFGAGGVVDRMFNNFGNEQLEALGMFRKNDSKDPAKAWSSTEMFDDDGNRTPIDPIFGKMIDRLIHEGRNRSPSAYIKESLLYDFNSLINEAGATDEAAVQRRMKFLYASGRGSWFDPKTGGFKKPLEQLYADEWKPLGDLFETVLTRKENENGELFGLKLKRTRSGSLALSGTPNPEQVALLREYIAQYNPYSQTGHPDTLENMFVMLEAIAAGNYFDTRRDINAKDARGWTQVFTFTYASVTSATKVGSSLQKTLSGGSPKEVMIAPLGMLVLDSTLDITGKAKTPDFMGRAPGLPEAYIYGVDMRKQALRVNNAWKGILYDKRGKAYFDKDEIQAMWGTKENMILGMNAVLETYQNFGTLNDGPFNHQPELRGWQTLIPFANGNEKKAKAMANQINRIIGFIPPIFVEMSALEKELAGKGVKDRARKEARLDDLRRRFQEPDEETGMMPEDMVSDRQKAMSEQVTPNPLGDIPMRDAQHIFGYYRLDRIQGIATPVQTKNGPMKVRFNAFTQDPGMVNWASTNWLQIKDQDVQNIAANFNLGGKSIVEAWYHQSDYKLFKLQEPRINGRFGKQVWYLFDSNRGVVGTGYADKADALNAAERHALSGNQRPASGNKIEKALEKIGFIPSGIDFAGRIRNKFVSTDGFWIVEKASKGYNLIDKNTGLIIIPNIAIGLSIDGKTPHIKELISAVQFAKDNNLVRIKADEAFEAFIKDNPKLADWRYIAKGDSRSQQLIAPTNRAYYQFRQRLGDNFGWDFAYEISELMKKELGVQVVNSDPVATNKWIMNWVKTHDFGPMIKIHESVAKSVSELDKAQIALNDIGQSQKLTWSKPVPPRAGDYESAATYKYLQEKYMREALIWEAYHKHADQKPITRQTIIDLNTWANELIARSDTEVKQAGKEVPLTQEQQDALVAQETVARWAKARTEVKESLNTAGAQLLSNDAGYIIKSMMYEATDSRFNGLQLRGNKSIVIGGKNVVSWGNDGFAFVVYSPSGAVIAKTNSYEKAQEEVFKHSKSIDVAEILKNAKPKK